MSTPGFLAFESALTARIESAVIVPGLKVLTRSQLSGVQAASQPVPAVHVIPDDFAVTEDKGLVEIVERWLTVVVVRNVRNAASGEDARADAGPIMDAVFTALLGWQTDGVKPLLPAKAPGHGFTAGFGYFPMAWSARLKKIPMPCPTLI